MSRIPDCRTDECYNQKYLNEKDKAFLRGYDWCCEMVVDNLFDNLDVYTDNDSHLMHMLNENMPEEAQEEYDMEYAILEREPEKRKTEKYIDLFRMYLLDWIERSRDELITSMIDDMGAEEYQAIKAHVDKSTGE